MGRERRRGYDTGVVSPFMPDPEKIAAVRRLLPATAAGIYLNAGTCGPIPAETQRAMDEQAARELAVGRAHPDQWPDATSSGWRRRGPAWRPRSSRTRRTSRSRTPPPTG